MKYTDALNYINDKSKFGSRLGLEVIGKLLELLGNPHKDLKYIHIAGTNGKGSTAAFLTSMLMAGGYKVGTFTSPYIERFNERMTINNIGISDDKLGELTERVKKAIDIMLEDDWEHPTTFEIVTAIAFLYFREEMADYIILEVGLGGRSDSTNIIDNSLASVITTIAYDHVEILGDTLGKIAYEKAGIIKENGLVISYPQDGESLKILKDVAFDKNAEFIYTDMENVHIKEVNDQGSVFDYEFRGISYKDVEISLLGKYQVYNSILALTTLLILKDKNLLDIKVEDLYKGLKKAKWKGRIEVIKSKPTFLIDGGHNLQGIKNLVSNLKLFKYRKIILGIGILMDKDVENMVEVIAPKVDKIIVTEVDMPRKMDAGDLEKLINKFNTNTHVERDLYKAVEKAYSYASEEDLIIFTGSLYLIGDIRKIVINR